MDTSMRPFLYIFICTELFSAQSETLEVNNLQFRIGFFQHFSYCLLGIHDIFLISKQTSFKNLPRRPLAMF